MGPNELMIIAPLGHFPIPIPSFPISFIAGRLVGTLREARPVFWGR